MLSFRVHVKLFYRISLSVACRACVMLVWKLPQQSAWKFRTMLGPWNYYQMQYYDVNTNPRWRNMKMRYVSTSVKENQGKWSD